MAENVLKLKCRACGADIMLAQTNYNHGWGFENRYRNKGRELFCFLYKHSICHKRRKDLSDEERENLMYYPFELAYDVYDRGTIASIHEKAIYKKGYEDAGQHNEIVEKLEAEVEFFRNESEHYKEVNEIEIRRLQAIIDSQKQSHGWQILELERENKLLKEELKDRKENGTEEI